MDWKRTVLSGNKLSIPWIKFLDLFDVQNPVRGAKYHGSSAIHLSLRHKKG